MGERLHALLKKWNMHLATGFLGTAHLCDALTDLGHADDAVTLLLNEDYPSWLYEVNMGATTTWERWNSVLPDAASSSGSIPPLSASVWTRTGRPDSTSSVPRTFRTGSGMLSAA